MSVKVYGFTHSPWVQAVLLALCDKELEYELYVRPPYDVFKKWGVYMPVVSLDDGPWEIESTQILTKLGYKPVLADELKAANNAWQGVLHRTEALAWYKKQDWIVGCNYLPSRVAPR